MDIDTFVTLADRYVALGWSVQEQLKTVLENGGPSNENPNALKLIDKFLKGIEPYIKDAPDIREDISAALR